MQIGGSGPCFFNIRAILLRGRIQWSVRIGDVWLRRMRLCQTQYMKPFCPVRTPDSSYISMDGVGMEG